METIRIKNIFQKFGCSDEDPKLFDGGQGTSYRLGDLVIKPVDNEEQNIEIAEMMCRIESTNNLRLQKPVKSINNKWIEEGFVCWRFIEGKESDGRFEEKVQICTLFEEAFKQIEQPSFCKEMPRNPWNIADEKVWSSNIKQMEFHPKFAEIVKQVIDKLQPLDLKRQLIHGDISGNILFSEKGLPPAVIDLTFYWRPSFFTHAFLVVDSISWVGADATELYGYVKHLPNIDQLLLRAALRRILEQQEHFYVGKDLEEAYKEAQNYIPTLKKLNLL